MKMGSAASNVAQSVLGTDGSSRRRLYPGLIGLHMKPPSPASFVAQSVLGTIRRNLELDRASKFVAQSGTISQDKRPGLIGLDNHLILINLICEFVFGYSTDKQTNLIII